VQHAIGEHAFLADSRTAALVAPDGNVAWLCWPRIDSDPLFFSLLDDDRGGEFSVRPRQRAVFQRPSYLPVPLIAHTEWPVGGATVTVDDMLLQTDVAAVHRVIRATGDADVDVVCAPSRWPGRVPATLRIDGARLHIDNDVQHVVVHAPAAWTVDGSGARCSVFVHGDGPAFVTLCDAAASPSPASLREAEAATTARWNQAIRVVDDVVLRESAAGALGADTCRRLLRVAAAVLLGLHHTAGGIVAAPTTSLPQWPGSSRCWDYRLCWPRDAALAGLAFVRLGLLAEAQRIGAFLGHLADDDGIPSVVRVDGAVPSGELELHELGGYRGALPVRTGNAASEQAQLDVAGEVIELAHALFQAESLPDELARAVPLLAAATVDRWRRPDHGIWEIRGEPRRYTHSQVAAWSGLERAAVLSDRGAVAGDSSRWRAEAAAIRAAVLDSGYRALELHRDGGGADAALSVAVRDGFLAPHDPRSTATLDLIASRLDRSGVLDRYEGQPDGIGDRCAPFVFPTFWMASAEEMAGRDPAPRLRAAAGARGRWDLFGEVADPVTGGPLGNYPQVQSHAALIIALTQPRLSSRS